MALFSPVIVPISEQHIDGFRAAVDSVARERRYLAQQHSGILGMGVISEYRGKGIGRALMQATLAAATASGMRRIELTVRVDNDPARRLYESLGFVTEGLCKHHMCIDGQFVDSWLMALLP